MPTVLIEAMSSNGVKTLLEYDGERLIVADGKAKGRVIAHSLYNASIHLLKDYLAEVGAKYISHVVV